MNTIDCIKTRRSIREFENREVSIDTIREIVDIATFAPSWKNSQTTRYIAVMDKAVKDDIANNGVMGSLHNKGIIDSAPCLIVLTTVNKRSGYERDGSFSTSKGTHWQSFDAGIACQTFVLTAHEKGLASVIMGILDADKIAEILGLDESQSVSALIALGYSNTEPTAPKRKTSEEILTIK